MPRTEELIESLATAKFISTLDLTKGYWQVLVAPASIEKTAFITPFGKYEFTRMPFGLMGAPATFQRMMDGIFEGSGAQTVVYIDDVAVKSDTWEESAGGGRRLKQDRKGRVDDQTREMSPRLPRV